MTKKIRAEDIVMKFFGTTKQPEIIENHPIYVCVDISDRPESIRRVLKDINKDKYLKKLFKCKDFKKIIKIVDDNAKH